MYFWNTLSQIPWSRRKVHSYSRTKWRLFPKPKTIKQLKQFLATINFYRRFHGAVKDQARLNDILGKPKTEGKTSIE